MDNLVSFEKRKFDIAYRRKLLRGNKLSNSICVIHSYEIEENIFPEDLTSPEAIKIAKKIVESLNCDFCSFVFAGIVIRENMLNRHYYSGYNECLI